VGNWAAVQFAHPAQFWTNPQRPRFVCTVPAAHGGGRRFGALHTLRTYSTPENTPLRSFDKLQAVIYDPDLAKKATNRVGEGATRGGLRSRKPWTSPRSALDVVKGCLAIAACRSNSLRVAPLVSHVVWSCGHQNHTAFRHIPLGQASLRWFEALWGRWSCCAGRF